MDFTKLARRTLSVVTPPFSRSDPICEVTGDGVAQDAADWIKALTASGFPAELHRVALEEWRLDLTGEALELFTLGAYFVKAAFETAHRAEEEEIIT